MKKIFKLASIILVSIFAFDVNAKLVSPWYIEDLATIIDGDDLLYRDVYFIGKYAFIGAGSGQSGAS